MINYRKKLEKKLKRKLKSTEIVHHKDGDNYNDKHSNFKIVTQKEHAIIPKKKRIINDKDYLKMMKCLNYREIKDFRVSLETIFTPYQISIIFRKLQSKTLSKTDKEVYSRSIKKKLMALANGDLFKIAQTMVY